MAGLGRRTHYRKHLTDSIIYDYPEPGDNERIAKVVATRGGNQFDILLPIDAKDADAQQPQGQLAILPTKFNKLVWVKRNDFVIVETATAYGCPRQQRCVKGYNHHSRPRKSIRRYRRNSLHNFSHSVQRSSQTFAIERIVART